MKTMVKRQQQIFLGVEKGEENPLPVLSDLEQDKEILTDGTLKPDEEILLGKKTGLQVLPYLMQNRYSRDKKDIETDVIVLENDYLKATFLPGFGGRLYSLHSKTLGRELLFKNPTLQLANIAIRDAWFAGGIEWNIGRIGHAVTTSDNLFVGKLTDEDGNEFIRMYEFERQNRLFWQIDIHLPEDAKELWTHVRIVNPDEEAKHLYWWTNIALPLTEETRVFSGDREVFYVKPYDPVKKEIRYGHGTLPFIKDMGEGDMSFPERITFGSEYFYQNKKEMEAPWEAAVYEDGYMFYECSTQPLRVRKMFTWGNSTGGKNWQDFLALPEQGAYVEIQGGLAPSQLHGYVIEAGESVHFTQVFSADMLDAARIDYKADDYNEVCDQIQEVVYEGISKERLATMDEKLRRSSTAAIEEMLNVGNSFGWLESQRSGKEVPVGMCFEREVDPKDAIWQAFLQTGVFPQVAPESVPTSYMIDDKWEVLFENAKEESAKNWAYWYYYSVYLYENGKLAESIDAIQHSLACEETAWALYLKAALLVKSGDTTNYVTLLESAYKKGKDAFSGLADKLIEAYAKEKMYQETYDLYQQEKERDFTKKLLLHGAEAGMALGDLSLVEELYGTEVANLREGENNYTLMWFEYTARKYAADNGVAYTKELLEKVKAEQKPPKHLDFRMNATIMEA